MKKDSLKKTTQNIIKNGRGLLAADESNGTMGKRLADIGVENTEENRRAFREILFTTPGFEEYCGGVILYEETLTQKTSNGKPFVELLSEKGIVPGIKVDCGAHPLANSHGEMITEGLDGLRERFGHYYHAGARFAKWRAVIEIDEAGRPSGQAIHANAEALARYAALAQEAGIVPIVEPEVLMDGDHTIERCDLVTREVLETVFDYLLLHRVELDGLLLKPNMVISGKQCEQETPRDERAEDVATKTVHCLRDNVPSDVPGIVFLSGGQGEVEATENLQAINSIEGGKPWVLSFSYGRALQQGALKTWQGKAENIQACQQTFLHRAHMNWLAAHGNYSQEIESKKTKLSA